MSGREKVGLLVLLYLPGGICGVGCRREVPPPSEPPGDTQVPPAALSLDARIDRLIGQLHPPDLSTIALWLEPVPTSEELLTALETAERREPASGQKSKELRNEAERLERDLVRLRREGQYEAAIGSAIALQSRYQNLYGPKHWKTINANVLLTTCRSVARLPSAEQDRAVCYS